MRRRPEGREVVVLATAAVGALVLLVLLDAPWPLLVVPGVAIAALVVIATGGARRPVIPSTPTIIEAKAIAGPPRAGDPGPGDPALDDSGLEDGVSIADSAAESVSAAEETDPDPPRDDSTGVVGGAGRTPPSAAREPVAELRDVAPAEIVDHPDPVVAVARDGRIVLVSAGARVAFAARPGDDLSRIGPLRPVARAGELTGPAHPLRRALDGEIVHRLPVRLGGADDAEVAAVSARPALLDGEKVVIARFEVSGGVPR